MKRSKNKFCITANDLGSLETTAQKLANERAMFFFGFQWSEFQKENLNPKRVQNPIGKQEKNE